MIARHVLLPSLLLAAGAGAELDARFGLEDLEAIVGQVPHGGDPDAAPFCPRCGDGYRDAGGECRECGVALAATAS